MANETRHMVSMPVVETDGMFFRMAAASGEIGGLKFDLSTSITGGSLFLSIDGRRFKLDAKDFITAVYDQCIREGADDAESGK